MKSGKHPGWRESRDIDLPKPEFLFTLDQISMILSIKIETLKLNYLYYEGRSVGVHKPQHMRAVNINHVSKRPDWRVQERELRRWMRHKGFTYYNR